MLNALKQKTRITYATTYYTVRKPQQIRAEQFNWDDTKWDDQKCTCDISIPGYITNVLNKLQNVKPKHPQHTPSKYATPVYGAKKSMPQGMRHLTYPQKKININKITGLVL